MAQPEPASQDALARLLAEQSTHYDELAPAYRDGALDLPGADELEQAVHDLALPGDLLELACGPGVWTPILLRHARTITAVDSSPRMLALARNQVGADVERVLTLAPGTGHLA